MSIFKAFFDGLLGSPLKATACEHKSLNRLDAQYEQMEATRARRAMQIERDAYKGQLRASGFSERQLSALVEMHRRTLMAQVRAS